MPIALRSDFRRWRWLGVAAKRSKDGQQARRLLALAADFDEGASRSEGGQDRRRDAPDRLAIGFSSSPLTGRTA